MNAKTKQRLIVVTGIIVIALIVVLAVVGGGTAAKAITLEEAASGQYANQRVQVTGNVVPGSYSTHDDMLSFSIYDPDAADAASAATIAVLFEGGASATFGNDVTAICTGKIGDDGVLACSELVTKCPSKYESGVDALSVSGLYDYGEKVFGKPVKVVGAVVPHTQRAAGEGDRFVVADTGDETIELPVSFDGALSDETVADGTIVVLTGDFEPDGRFSATNVAIEG